MEFAIVDIETTGGNASGSRMTEIAICIHDGNQVVARYESLINPEKEIPRAIFALTGIDDDMVRDAPRFGEIAEKVHNLLNGRIFVAHNVNFDYSFVRHQLEEEGYKWTAKKLCTVRMARKIKPGLRSYSLGRLCDCLGIPLENRHRAGGDCDATAILFDKLLRDDWEGVIPGMLKATAKDQTLPPNLPREQLEALPERPGVYYFHDKGGKVIYVGKALNIRKRVIQHFSGHNISPQRQHFLREIHTFSSETCATELMALVLECVEIRRLWPTYNRALKRFEPKFGLILYEDLAGYKRLAIGKLGKHQTCIQVFYRETDAASLLRQLMDEFGIDHRFCSFGIHPGRLSMSAGARGSGAHDSGEHALPSIEEHNGLVDAAIDSLEAAKPTYAILDKGLEPGEKSCIWIEKGTFYAMGYLHTETQLNSPDDVRDSLTRYSGNHYIMQLIYSHIEKHPAKVWKVGDGEAPNPSR